MPDLGADYSYARPGGAALAAAGVVAVGRYLIGDARGITAAEYQDLVAHGIKVWVCYENSATGMLNGYAQGVADAQAAQAHLVAAGLPPDTLIFATADFDVPSAQFPACDAYLQGFASVLGVNRTGIYGGTFYLNHVHTAGLARGFWECGSTSFAHGQAVQYPLHLQQTTKTPPVAGTDHNYIFDHSVFAGASAPVVTPKWKEADMLYIYSVNRGGGVVGPTGFYPLDPTSEEAQVALATYGTPNVPNGTLSDREWDVARQTAINIGAQLVADVAKQITAGTVDAKAIADAVVAALPASPEGATVDTGALAQAVETAIAAQLAALPAAIIKAEGSALSGA